MVRMSFLGVVVSLVAISTTQIHAQVPEVRIGDVVRVTLKGTSPPVEGIFTGWEAERWIVSPSGGMRTSIDPSEVIDLERRTSQSNASRGALIGAAVMLGVGLLYVATSEPCDDGLLDDLCKGTQAAAMVLGPVVGAGGGALIGMNFRTDRWVSGRIPDRQPPGVAVTVTWALTIH